MAMISEPTIGRVKNSQNSGQLGRGIYWPGPPDLLRQIHDGAGAAVDTVRSDDAHFLHQLLSRQVKQGRYTRVLKGREAEAALFKHPAEAPREHCADCTFTVKTDPAAHGTPSFRISHFCN